MKCMIQHPSIAAMPARNVQVNKPPKQQAHSEQAPMTNSTKAWCDSNRAIQNKPHSTGEPVTATNKGNDYCQQQLCINNGHSLNAKNNKLSSTTTKASFFPQRPEYPHQTQTMKG